MNFPADATQGIGLASFGLSTIAAFLAARRGAGRGWQGIGLLQAVCWLEMVLANRHRVHDVAGQWLQRHGQYAERMPLQHELLIAAGATAVATLLLLGWLTRRAGCAQRLAWAATAATLALFAIEAVSLHAVDAVMYRSIGGVLLVGWWWSALAAVVVAAAIRAGAFRPGSARAHRR
ncbi:MAG TPA: hypothetical protein VNU71_12135 [Burkholderiaceae bacterium]|nr:hypothetical protein [Burkholderiaceae bacterium]